MDGDLTLKEKCSSTTMTRSADHCRRPPSITILVDFVVDGKSIFLVAATLYCQGFGQNAGRSVRVVDFFYAASFFYPDQVFTNVGIFSLF
jgi:hypothetical protein